MNAEEKKRDECKKVLMAEKRREIANGVDELSYRQQKALFLATVMQVGLKSFKTVPEGAAINLDKLTDEDIDAIYAVYARMARENEEPVAVPI